MSMEIACVRFSLCRTFIPSATHLIFIHTSGCAMNDKLWYSLCGESAFIYLLLPFYSVSSIISTVHSLWRTNLPIVTATFSSLLRIHFCIIQFRIFMILSVSFTRSPNHPLTKRTQKTTAALSETRWWLNRKQLRLGWAVFGLFRWHRSILAQLQTLVVGESAPRK